MNNIKKIPLKTLGYNFVAPQHLPQDQDEYYLRNLQNRSGISYRQLSAYEIEVLVRNRNTSDNWNNLLVSNAFNPELVKNCKFYGLVRIGKLEPFFLEYSQLKVPVGLYNSTIVSCDFGDNVVVDNVNYLSHYIVGNEVIIVNVNEMLTTPFAKFGNGIVKAGESEDIRIWMELCNENGGRKVIPFVGMLAADAWLWSKHRDNEPLLEKFMAFTQKQFDTRQGYYGKVGDRTVIKNCAIIKDVWVGSDAYLKGANKLKNLTIQSRPGAKSQIGEGCELVNGIVGFGCRVFYGVKAVRFIMDGNSQLKYGARLINSYLGSNATISCCEVLNSLIFPGHEQHHNNSFLCAATVLGQSNMAAGATIGSNHNSRSADGELLAGRGFWPGLCVSLKHNCRFAAFTMIAKGDYNHEMDVPLPFALISQQEETNTLTIMPCYWFLYNMYALARNAWKYKDRDRRPDKLQHIEFDYLAPDTVNEMFTALGILETCTGYAAYAAENVVPESAQMAQARGRHLLETHDASLKALKISAPGFENSKRTTLLAKVPEAYACYRRMITYYGAMAVMGILEQSHATGQPAIFPKKPARLAWTNVGGQLMPEAQMAAALTKVVDGKITSWEGLHNFYAGEGKHYEQKKQLHALASLRELTGYEPQQASAHQTRQLLEQALETKQWMLAGIVQSRSKDHDNSFRKMMYSNTAEMDAVLGSLADNAFIKKEKDELETFTLQVASILKRL
ncbi:MAG: DUF4954 family protein [Bacteroidetes bacterium]|nr:MAG: DUF4954 family protein [Bacteroidota bacterium]